MICKKCRKEIFTEDLSFCPYCGSYLLTKEQITPTKKTKTKTKQNSSNKLLYSSLIIIWLSLAGILYVITKEFYYFDEETDTKLNSTTIVEKNNNQNAIISGTGITSIKYDNQYKKTYVNGSGEVYDLIIEDSIKQKNNCPNEIVNIENDIINNYRIKAVNLCELSPELAQEIKNIVGYIYDNYPKQRGYLTNLTLGNVGEDSYMAAFMPIFIFVTSDTKNTYPLGVKTQIILNASYFLDEPRLNSSIKHGLNIGYYPPNTTTSTTIAHEFGHYLSFRAMLKYYNTNTVSYVNSNNSSSVFKIYDDFLAGDFSYKILYDAYLTFHNDYDKSLSFDEFRNTISNYAIAKDNDGKYIYDETIAEAFHDYYLNGENAKIASKLIMQSLNRYL